MSSTARNWATRLRHPAGGTRFRTREGRPDRPLRRGLPFHIRPRRRVGASVHREPGEGRSARTPGREARTAGGLLGMGAMPDQYGRRWAEDDGSSPVPPDPGPDRSRAPLIADAPSFDRVEVTAATGAGDADRFLDAVFGHDLDAGLQQIGAGMVMALDRHRDRAETPALSVVN